MYMVDNGWAGQVMRMYVNATVGLSAVYSFLNSLLWRGICIWRIYGVHLCATGTGCNACLLHRCRVEYVGGMK